MASSASQPNENAEGGFSTARQDALVIGQAGDSKPLLIALHGQSSIAYVVALVAGGGPSGSRTQPVQVQRLSMPYQPCYCTQNPDSTYHSTTKLNIPLSPSLKYASQVSEVLRSQCWPRPCQFPVGVRPTSAEVAKAPTDQIQDLRTLAQWPLLHHPTLPSPIVGDIESDQWGIADRYGSKGQSVLTAFFDTDELTCHVCAFKADTLELALLHQQQEHHFRLQ